MKNINKVLSGVLIASLTLGATSCGDGFLEENASHTTTDALLETGQGALAMAAGLYGNLRWHFGYEHAYATTLYGCDEFSMGSDETSLGWMDYNSAEMNPAGSSRRNHPSPADLWNELYYGISTANLLLQKAPNIASEQDRKSAMGEAYFLRGYNYYRLFCQYERCPLQLEPLDVSGGVPRNFKLASGEEVLNQVIDDLQNAYEIFTNEQENMSVTQRVFDNTSLKFQQGVASNLELVNASNDLITAQSTYVQAVLTLVNAEVELEKFLNL